MDANDWCLTCDKFLQDGCEGPYCSDNCRSMAFTSNPQHTASSSVYAASHYPSHAHSFVHRQQQRTHTPTSSCRESVYSVDTSASQYPPSSRASRGRDDVSTSAWIGKGVAGIYDWARQVEPGLPPHARTSESSSLSCSPTEEIDSLRPALLSSHSKRRPAPPKLFVSAHPGKTQPAPPMPSRPILAAQTSMPSLLTHSATASLTSIATPLSLAHASQPPSARSSMHIPSKPASETGYEDDQGPPSAETQKPSLFSNIAGKLSAQLKSWAAGERSALVNNPPYSTSHQFPFASEHGRRPPAAVKTAETLRATKYTSPYASSKLFPLMDTPYALHDELEDEGPLRVRPRVRLPRDVNEEYLAGEKGMEVRDDHPAFLARGRRTERAVW